MPGATERRRRLGSYPCSCSQSSCAASISESRRTASQPRRVPASRQTRLCVQRLANERSLGQARQQSTVTTDTADCAQPMLKHDETERRRVLSREAKPHDGANQFDATF